MLSQNFPIQEFLLTVPICGLTTCLRDLRSHLTQESLAGSDRLVVVNQEELPIGVIYLHSLIPYFNPDEFLPTEKLSPIAHVTEEPIQSLMQPLTVLPGSLSVREFWRQLQELPPGQVAPKDWGLVNLEGKFLGLLDFNALLGFVASHYQLQEINPQVLWPSENKNVAVAVSTSENGCEQRAKHTEILDWPVAEKIAAIEQVLERLPMPVKLQNEDGRAIAENLAWRQEFGELSNTEMSVSPDPAVTKYGTTLTHLLSDPESEATLMCSLSNGSEQSWKFFKIPLELDLSISKAIEIFSAQKSCNSGEDKYSHPESPAEKLRSPPSLDKSIPNSDRPSQDRDRQLYSRSPLSWNLIIAEDVSEQQQVAKELVAKNADLVQLNRLKDEFLACISHELKTPLTAVLGLSTLLKDRALGPLNERQARYAKMIYQSGQHLMRVVNDILDLTRIETGQLQLNWEPVELNLVCDHALQQAMDAQKSESATTSDRHLLESIPQFTLEIEPGLDTILADHLRLRQMLYNLLSNALKFTAPEGAIGLNISRWQGWIAFTVWDTGIGIPGDKQHLIFQRFQQLENPLTRRFEGTGLGLVLTQGLARAHGGDVTFISKEEKGSKFTILLPPAPSEPGTIKEFPVRDRRLVLIVEAVPQYIEDLHEHLVQLGYRVAISRCGIDALEKARRLQPCAIFLNPLLPLLSGWDLLTLLKSDPQTRHIPAIMTATVVDKKRARQLRADGCLSLPLSEEKLRDQLEYVTSVELPESLDMNTRKLTILRLTANIDIANPTLIQGLRNQPTKAYQILEADDLEQAELLAEIWQPQVLLIEPSTAMPDPQGFFQKLSQSSILVNLPIVTMDIRTTQAANQVPGLMIFPCLADRKISTDTSYQINNSPTDISPVNSINLASYPDRQKNDAVSISSILPPANYLLKAIELAAKQKVNPNVLAVNLGILPEFYQPNGVEEDLADRQRLNHPNNSVTIDGFMELISGLKTIDLNVAIGRCWSEVWHIIQQQSVDLLLLYVPVDYLVMPLVNGLKAIGKMAYKPPILIVYDRANRWISGELASAASDCAGEFKGNPGDILETIATKIIPNSLSQEELLQEIQQLLNRQTSAIKNVEHDSPVKS